MEIESSKIAVPAILESGRRPTPFAVTSAALLHEQLAAIDGAFKALGADMKAMNINWREEPPFISLQTPKKARDDLWSWITDYVANKCLVIRFFTTGQPRPSPITIDEQPQNNHEKSIKIRHALLFKKGVDEIPVLRNEQTGENIQLFDAFTDFLAEKLQKSPVNQAVIQQAISHAEQLQASVIALSETLDVIRHQYDLLKPVTEIAR